MFKRHFHLVEMGSELFVIGQINVAEPCSTFELSLSPPPDGIAVEGVPILGWHCGGHQVFTGARSPTLSPWTGVWG